MARPDLLPRLLRCRRLSRSSAETVLFPLFTLPSLLDTITIDAAPRPLQHYQFDRYIAGSDGEVDWSFIESGDQKQEPPRGDFLNGLLGG